MTRITRRAAVGSAFAGVAACAGPAPRLAYAIAEIPADALFAHGVASGDPAPDSVVLWTRISAPTDAPLRVAYEVATDAEFADIVVAGETDTGPDRDYTAKIVAAGLAPGTTYFYRFRVGDTLSPVGRTRTMPTGVLDVARFAVVSCSNVPFGHFNVYDLLSKRADIDAVLHLGDYIYEYGAAPGQYGADVGERLGRIHQPPHEVVTLADYRTRHAQYKADPGARAAHAAHPFITIWDDHETANNSWADGAQNHQPDTEGDWQARKRAALQAYYEWMPIRDPEPGRPKEAIFRAFSFGDLLTVTALETRLMTRTKEIEYNAVVPTLTSPEAIAEFREKVLWAPDRNLLGDEQLEFIKETFRRSAAAGQKWRLIANQVIMAKVTAPNLEPHLTEENLVELEAEWDQARAFVKFSTMGLPVNLDAWDGYPAARERLYDAAREVGADGLVVVTGDTHTWWANDLTARDGKHMGVELGVHSVTSRSPYRKEFLGGKGAEYALLTGRDNPDVRYISGENHGYILLSVTKEEIDAKFMAVSTVESPAYDGFEKVAFKIRKSAGAAQFVDVSGLSLAERAVF